MKIALYITSLALSTQAFAFDAKDCAKYVKEKKYPAAYCMLTDEKSPELATWLESLRAIPGPIQTLEKNILADIGCGPEDACGIDKVVAKNRIVLSQGNDSMGGGSRVRYFVYYSERKSEHVAYTIDVIQSVDMETETSIRKIGKIQRFND
jgi:hypothetical protein